MWVCFFIGAGLDVVIGLPMLRQVIGGALFNPDSYMRLVRLNAIVAAQAPLHAVMGDASGAGTVLAWSHLLDSFLLVGAVSLAPLMGWPDALHWTGVVLGPIEVGLLCAAVAWALAPLSEPGWRWTAALAAVTAAPVAGYGMPGVVHHHILLAVAAVMTAGWAGRGLGGSALAGWQAGIWAAIGLWLSPETMPFTLMAFGALGVASLGRPSGRALLAGGMALLILVAAIVAVDPPAGGVFAAEIDRISVVYVEMALALCAIGLLFCVLHRRVLAGCVAALCLGGWIAANPKVILGPEGLLDAEVAEKFFGAIAEMRPVLTLHDADEMLALGVFGAAVVVALAWRQRSALCAYAALCAVVVVALGAVHVRFSTYGAVLGAGMLPVAITAAGRRLAGAPALVASLGRVGLFALFLLIPHAQTLAGGPAEAGQRSPACAVRDTAGMLAPFVGQVVLGDVNDTPELLYRTGVRTVGSLYHRNITAFLRLRAAWRSRERQEVLATGAAAVLACPGRGRSPLVNDLPDDTLLDRLDRNDPPAWLERIGSEASGFVLYRVVR
jgi:hypothetical protein